MNIKYDVFLRVDDGHIVPAIDEELENGWFVYLR